MNRTYRFLILGFVLSCFGDVLASDSSPATVAIVDFAVSAEASNTWAWVRGGIADLLQVELDQRGLVTLDRSFIHAVLSERRMAVGGLTTTDCRSIATLLGAKYLVTGKVMPLADGKCRIEASAFSVETIETVAAGVGEGVLPKELPVILQKIADSLASALLKGRDASAGERIVKGWRPDPEALIAYYKGLDAYGAGYPEIAAVWFMDSADLDKNYVPAQLWEIKAYHAAGLESYAHIRERDLADLIRRVGVKAETTNGVSGAGVRSVALIEPSVVPLDKHTPTVDAGAVSEALKLGVLGVADVRLFEPSHLADSLVEQDRALSGLFSSRGGIRYGQWSMADALLFCRVEDQAGGNVRLTLSIRDPLSSASLVEEQVTTAASDVGRTAQTRAALVVKKWAGSLDESAKHGSLSNAMVRADERLDSSLQVYSAVGPFCRFVMLFPDELRRISELPMRHQDIAGALLERRRMRCEFDIENPQMESELLSIVDDYTQLNRYPQAAAELRRLVEEVDLKSENAPQKLYKLMLWYNGPRFSSSWPWFKHRDEPMNLLLDRFPNTIWAAGIRMRLAAKYWDAGNWPKAGDCARESRRVLSDLIASQDRGTNVNEKGQRCVKAAVPDLRRAIATDYFIEADSLAASGRTNEVINLTGEAAEYMRKYSVPTNFPGALIGIENWSSALAGGAGSGGPFADAGWAHQRRLGCYAERITKPTGEAHVSAPAAPTDVDQILGVLSRSPQVRSDCDRAAERLVALLEAGRDDQTRMDVVMQAVAKGLPLYSNGGHPDPQRRGDLKLLLNRVVKTTIVGGRGTTPLAPERQKERALYAVSLYESCGFAADWVAELRPCFEEPYPTEVGISLLLRGNLQARTLKEAMDRVASRLPDKDADFPFALLMKYAHGLVSENRYGEGLAIYRQAFERGAPRKPYALLLVAMTQVAVGKDADRVDEEIKRLCAEVGLPGADPLAPIWFNIGRQEQEAKRFGRAAICYRHVLDFFEQPDRHQDMWFWSESFPWGNEKFAEVKGGYGKTTYSLWDRRTKLSARFFLAECLIETGGTDEAAEILRKFARECGNESVWLLRRSGEYDSKFVYLAQRNGADASRLLEKLHAQSEPLVVGTMTNAEVKAKQGK